MRLFILAALTLQLFRISTSRSRAYLDPGNGAMILQILLGGVAGIAVIWRMFWHRLGNMFRFGRADAKDVPGTDE